jgi:hypothetical protein
MVRSDRPTVPPSFNVEQYAKDSDARIAQARVLPDDITGAATTQPQSETRLLTRTNDDAALGDEAWIQTMTGAPALAVSSESLKQLPLDHRAGFLLSLMDGSMDLPTLVEVSSMQREDALRIVRDLHAAGVILFR